MRGIRWLLALLALATVPGALAASSTQRQVRALLVGVSAYPMLPAANSDQEPRQLVGPRHDVELLSEVLAARGVSRSNQLILADGVRGSSADPTRAAIDAAMHAVIRNSQPGDVFIAYFAGHGSRQPAQVSADEPDGYDEIFLPLDVGRWDGEAGAVARAIADNQFAQWFGELRRKGVVVWAIFDTCHSATLSRSIDAPGTERETSREVPPEVLGIPERAWPQQRAEPASRLPKPASGAWAAFYAAQSDETTPEFLLPMGSGSSRRTHGLFSYTLAQALSAGTTRTFRDLQQQMLFRYAELGRLGPTPDAEGDLDRKLPLADVAAAGVGGRSPMLVRREGSRWRLEAGELHGLQAGDAVRLRAGHDGADVIGFADISQLGPVTSYLQVRAAKADDICGRLAGKQPPEIGAGVQVLWAERCRSEDFRLRLGPPRECRAHPADVAAALRCAPVANRRDDAIARSLAAIDSFVAPQPGNPDVVLVLSPAGVWLAPVFRLPGTGALPLVRVAGAAGIDADASPDLDQRLQWLVLLRRLANLSASAYGAPAGVEVTVQAGRASDRGGCSGARQPVLGGEIPALPAGSPVSVAVHNRSPDPVDTLVIAMHQDGFARVLFPLDAGEHNRLNRGASTQVCTRVTGSREGSMTWLFVVTVPVRQPLTPRFDLDVLLPYLSGTRSLGVAGVPAAFVAVSVYRWAEARPSGPGS